MHGDELLQSHVKQASILAGQQASPGMDVQSTMYGHGIMLRIRRDKRPCVAATHPGDMVNSIVASTSRHSNILA